MSSGVSSRDAEAVVAGAVDPDFPISVIPLRAPLQTSARRPRRA